MKVYFNNSCKICRSEINLYKKENIKDIDWIDITNNEEAIRLTSKSKKDLFTDIISVDLLNFNAEKKYSDQLKRDEKKLDFCQSNGIKLAEVYPQDEIQATLFKNQDIYL